LSNLARAQLVDLRCTIVMIYVEFQLNKNILQKFDDFFHLTVRSSRLQIYARICIRVYSRIQGATATGHDVNPALGDPRGGSNAFRFCVSSATRESSQGQVVPRFRASLWHSGRALKIDSNQFYTQGGPLQKHDDVRSDTIIIVYTPCYTALKQAAVYIN